jgi:acyl carrier protein
MNKNEIKALIIEQLSRYLDRQCTEKELNEPYDRLGADSMDMVVLAYELEKALGRKIMPEHFMRYHSIQEALDALIIEESNEH